MKKTIALLLCFLLLGILFVSCDRKTNEEEGSEVSVSQPADESSSVEVSSNPTGEMQTSNEEESLVEVEISREPIVITEEDEAYFEKYLISLFTFQRFNYGPEEELNAAQILCLYHRFCYWEDGLYAATYDPRVSTFVEQDYSLEEIDCVMKTYLDDRDFAGIIRSQVNDLTGAVYNAETDSLFVETSRYGVGGFEDYLRPFFPVEKNGNEITIYYLYRDAISKRFIGGRCVVVEETEDGFHYISVQPFSEGQLSYLSDLCPYEEPSNQ